MRELTRTSHWTTLAILVVFIGCDGVRGSGTLKTETREIGSFTEVEVSGAFVVHITQGDQPSLQLSGDDNLLELVSTELSGTRLSVDTTESVRPELPLEVNIVMATLQELAVSGAAEVTIVDLRSETFTFDCSGACRAEISGQTQRANIEVSGAGRVNALELQADVAEVSISGAGRISICANEQLDASVDGAGRIQYACDPAEVNTSVDGVGEIEAL